MGVEEEVVQGTLVGIRIGIDELDVLVEYLYGNL